MQIRSHANKVNVINVFAENVRTEFGQLTQEAGQCAFTSLKAAVEDLASNKVDAIVTAPINKANIQSDGISSFLDIPNFCAIMRTRIIHLMILSTRRIRVAL